jgi:hypothetical protein
MTLLFSIFQEPKTLLDFLNFYKFCCHLLFLRSLPPKQQQRRRNLWILKISYRGGSWPRPKRDRQADTHLKFKKPQSRHFWSVFFTSWKKRTFSEVSLTFSSTLTNIHTLPKAELQHCTPLIRSARCLNRLHTKLTLASKSCSQVTGSKYPFTLWGVYFTLSPKVYASAKSKLPSEGNAWLIRSESVSTVCINNYTSVFENS